MILSSIPLAHYLQVLLVLSPPVECGQLDTPLLHKLQIGKNTVLVSFPVTKRVYL